MSESRTGRGRDTGTEPPDDERQGRGPLSPLVSRVRERVSSELNARKDRASEALADLAGTVRRIGEPLHGDSPLDTLGGYADEAAAKIDRMATDLRERDLSELADDVRGLARRNPAAFAAAGFAAGLLAARFLKSSAADQPPPPRASTAVRSAVRAPGAARSDRQPRRQWKAAQVSLDTTNDRTTK